jgi:hypothetical protein
MVELEYTDKEISGFFECHEETIYRHRKLAGLQKYRRFDAAPNEELKNVSA